MVPSKVRVVCTALFLLCALWRDASAQDESWKSALADARDMATDLREEIVDIPLLGAEPHERPGRLVGTLYKPTGDRRFPVIVLSHGAPGKASDRESMGRYRLLPQIRALLQMGYAVLVPMRRGYGATGGLYAESFGHCFEARYDRTGAESARDVQSAVEFLRSRPDLDAQRVVLMGQSAGGFASMAAASARPKGVIAVLNLSGGRGGNGINGRPCSPEAMAKVLGEYGKTTNVPVLWLYVENDLYFGPDVVRTWFNSYSAGGVLARLVVLPPHGRDGHLLFYAASGEPLWTHQVESFLRTVDLP